MFKPVPQRGTQIRVPASIANLGPGFDTLAVAVRLYLYLDVTPGEGENQLTFEFPDCKIDGENYIERAFRFAARQESLPFPSLHVSVSSDIPMKSGLGSSAAATVAGLRLYEVIAGPLPEQGLLNAACALEGHPDNVAAALLGGLTISCELPDRSAFAVKVRWPESLGIIVLTPLFPLSTVASRGALPDELAREDAVFNLQRAMLLLYGLQNGDFRVLREAFRDRIHQPYRQKLIPGLSEVLELEHPDLLGVCLSGAGPSVAAFARRNFEQIEALLSGIFDRTGTAYTIRRLTAHQEYDSSFDCRLYGLGI
jgi:homoserine kinase